MHHRLKQLLSFIYPIKEKIFKSKYHTLELFWYQGKLVLDSQHANYSFGNLHKVFQMAFKDSELLPGTISNVLLLGLGGGSVISLLENEYGFKGNVTAIDTDPEVIHIYHRYFSKLHKSNVKTVHADAMEFVTSCNEQFGLIVCDIFIDMNTPDYILSSAFLKQLKKVAQQKAIIYINYINKSSDKQPLLPVLSGIFKQISVLQYFDYNEIYVLNMP